MNEIAALVPYRPDGGWRDLSWRFVRDQIGDDITVIEGHDPKEDRPFSMGRAFNDARSQTDAPFLALWNADVLWDPLAVAESILLIKAGRSHVIPFWDMIRLTRAATENQLAGVADWDQEFPQPGCCNGLTVLSAAAWVEWDERFEGWGPDDLAWRRAMERAHGAPVMLSHSSVHLWHPNRETDDTPDERDARERSYALYETEYA